MGLIARERIGNKAAMEVRNYSVAEVGELDVGALCYIGFLGGKSLCIVGQTDAASRYLVPLWSSEPKWLHRMISTDEFTRQRVVRVDDLMADVDLSSVASQYESAVYVDADGLHLPYLAGQFPAGWVNLATGVMASPVARRAVGHTRWYIRQASDGGEIVYTFERGVE
jgi:hypothetical protein